MVILCSLQGQSIQLIIPTQKMQWNNKFMAKWTFVLNTSVIAGGSIARDFKSRYRVGLIRKHISEVESPKPVKPTVFIRPKKQQQSKATMQALETSVDKNAVNGVTLQCKSATDTMKVKQIVHDKLGVPNDKIVEVLKQNNEQIKYFDLKIVVTIPKKYQGSIKSHDIIVELKSAEYRKLLETRDLNTQCNDSKEKLKPSMLNIQTNEMNSQRRLTNDQLPSSFARTNMVTRLEASGLYNSTTYIPTFAVSNAVSNNQSGLQPNSTSYDAMGATTHLGLKANFNPTATNIQSHTRGANNARVDSSRQSQLFSGGQTHSLDYSRTQQQPTPMLNAIQSQEVGYNQNLQFWPRQPSTAFHSQAQFLGISGPQIYTQPNSSHQLKTNYFTQPPLIGPSQPISANQSFRQPGLFGFGQSVGPSQSFTNNNSDPVIPPISTNNPINTVNPVTNPNQTNGVVGTLGAAPFR
ncbi:hypothetical protein Bhyg_07919 [Pseudolycoriella hygida]|uniref:Uncharacterized protein n=1 Tax=Pseudolycoriella hygida TaxID=35572 RepID=A0A9Q0N3L4_9DIPT|nr:hypothetical protein Bhyg_07919 [Pseudolycoriella hygida]